ncbi:MAG TPA: alanine dehydrogenase [Actinomycetes bacterium]|jgi:alanine dehydrogenase|nr:alanine dehydrogenase [Actinomycetes bacterium]
MDVGIPRELKDHEYRVAITPVGVRELADAGHRVLVECNAGVGSSIPDSGFVRAGATILDTADEVWGEADLILKVKEPVPEEFGRLRAGQVLFTYLHLAASREVTEALLKSGTTAVAYETVELDGGRLPLLAPMSEVAGRMAPQVGAHLLERESGGRGVLMGGVSGVAPARVVVLGGGMAGQNAAWIAQGMEAEVIMLDTNIDKLRYVDSIHKGRILTLMSNRQTVEELVLSADLVIGSVLIPGAKAPRLVSREHVKAMKPGAVLVDISIDQGGCFETSHVTTHSDPTYVVDEVVHYCVGNMPGAVPHTSTYALTNVTLPYAVALASAGIEAAVRSDPPLAKGVNVWRGELTSEPVAAAHQLDWRPLEEAMGDGGGGR